MKTIMLNQKSGVLFSDIETYVTNTKTCQKNFIIFPSNIYLNYFIERGYTVGSQNIAEAMEVIRVEEIVKALKMDARVDVAIPLGAIQVAGTVETAAGPGTFNGTNINIPGFNGIVR